MRVQVTADVMAVLAQTWRKNRADSYTKNIRVKPKEAGGRRSVCKETEKEDGSRYRETKENKIRDGQIQEEGISRKLAETSPDAQTKAVKAERAERGTCNGHDRYCESIDRNEGKIVNIYNHKTYMTNSLSLPRYSREWQRVGDMIEVCVKGTTEV